MILSSRKGNFRGGFDRVIAGQVLALIITIAITASMVCSFKGKRMGNERNMRGTSNF
jgi:hypothetical protein